ncbi:MAG: hypothetical protein HYX55_11500 [Chloroflexi bacterium]|nr:hypothetical protein [Chloroflexota bacterium]
MFQENFSAGTLGTFPTYQAIYNPASGGAQSEFVFERNGSVLWRVSPTAWVPATVQSEGEIHNRTDQMPGGFNNPLYLDQMQYTTGGAWTDMNTNSFVTNSTIHSALKFSSRLYKIWDKACPT